MKSELLRTSLFALLIFPLSAKSTNYYITAGESGFNAGKSLSASLASVAKVISKVSESGTIYVRSSTYALTSRIMTSKSETSASKYYLFVYHADTRQILDFSGITIGSSNQGVLLYCCKVANT